MRTINQRDLRDGSGAVLRQVEAGESMIVTRNGTPVAELRPVARRSFVPATEWAAAVARIPRVDPDQLWEDLDRDTDR